LDQPVGSWLLITILGEVASSASELALVISIWLWWSEAHWGWSVALTIWRSWYKRRCKLREAELEESELRLEESRRHREAQVVEDEEEEERYRAEYVRHLDEQSRQELFDDFYDHDY
jgi:hypothetical protein